MAPLLALMLHANTALQHTICFARHSCTDRHCSIMQPVFAICLSACIISTACCQYAKRGIDACCKYSTCSPQSVPHAWLQMGVCGMPHMPTEMSAHRTLMSMPMLLDNVLLYCQIASFGTEMRLQEAFCSPTRKVCLPHSQHAWQVNLLVVSC